MEKVALMGLHILAEYEQVVQVVKEVFWVARDPVNLLLESIDHIPQPELKTQELEKAKGL